MNNTVIKEVPLAQDLPFKTQKRKLHIKTYGCQMNVYDSIRMQDVLSPFGFEITDTHEDANVVILNTCNIREKAAEKVYSELGRILPFKNKQKATGSNMIIVVAGCVGQAEGEEIFKRAPFVDIVVGPQSYYTLPDLIGNILRGEKKAINLEFSSEKKFDYLPEESTSQGVSAFLSVQEGCDKFCTFCIVPYTRGAEFSRPVAEVYREAVRLSEQGVKEITLLGQNVNAYHGMGPEDKTWSLAKLIKHVARIEGIKRIRYTTSHPRDMDDELIEAHGTEPKLMPYLHLPVQSGSDKILKAMNRRHTAEDYLKIIEKLRIAKPDIAFSSDFIVGFPGETEQDFLDTMNLVKQVGYAQCYSFKYSPRPGTPAAEHEVQVPEEAKAERLAELQKLLYEQQTQFNKNSVGLVMEVLFDKLGREEGQVVGKTPYMQSIHVDNAADYLGKLIDVKITDVKTNSLSGKVIYSNFLVQKAVS
jgi:tRNA-2-methylthio-N6-dimethylallyladenosine synthase